MKAASTAPMLQPLGPDPALQRLGDEIAELSAHLDAASARLLDLIRRFDAEGGWHTGFRSCAEWLAWRTGLDLGAARQKVRVARALGNLPRLAQALAHGELSYAKVRALTRVATLETEERLLKVGRAGTAEHVERIVRGWRWMDRKTEIDDTALQHERRALHVYRSDDGTVIVRGRLAPEVGALLLKALDAAREALYQQARAAAHVSAEPREDSDMPEVSDLPSMEQQQADALAPDGGAEVPASLRLCDSPRPAAHGHAGRPGGGDPGQERRGRRGAGRAQRDPGLAR